ncbi:hypothetical protein GCK32_015043 [Trichostrongylus colubriformis]|uniref:Uncharacterized protein n=1 Tax=Trichostrongylus colubriformis TaxID=6319 RepID=A0AAN8G7W6_TRICO
MEVRRSLCKSSHRLLQPIRRHRRLIHGRKD